MNSTSYYKDKKKSKKTSQLLAPIFSLHTHWFASIWSWCLKNKLWKDVKTRLDYFFPPKNQPKWLLFMVSWRYILNMVEIGFIGLKKSYFRTFFRWRPAQWPALVIGPSSECKRIWRCSARSHLWCPVPVMDPSADQYGSTCGLILNPKKSIK